LKIAKRVLCLLLAVWMLLAQFACTATPVPLAELTDFRQVPGITPEEIEAIESLQKKYATFTFAMMPPNTELFVGDNGELSGYSALLCKWLSNLFGITFVPSFYDWPDTLAGLADHSIDFSGELTATAERREYLFMTDSIGERTIKTIRYQGSRKITEGTLESPVRCCFIEGTTAYDCVAPYVSNIEVVFADGLADVQRLFAEGAIDIFVVDGTAEAVFDTEDDVIAEDFSPMIYSPVSMSTQNPELAPIIDVVQKILVSEHNYVFSDMYRAGYIEYMRRKLSLQLTPAEKAYITAHIQRGNPIRFAAKFDNYPISFYNTHDAQWQGISFDILDEIGALTGLVFEPGNKPDAIWADLLPQLRSGEIPMTNELIYSGDRAGNYLWAEEPYLTDNLALISTSDYGDTDTSRLVHARVGLVTESAYAEFFYDRFPDHKDVTVYPDLFSAVYALENGWVDLVMGTRCTLLNITNYLEKPGFKANMLFMRNADSSFGFHSDEVILCSIISKTQRLVNTHSIIDHWQRTVFDYKGALEREQRPLRISFSVLSVMIVVLLIVIVIRTRRSGVVLEATVKDRTRELEVQTKTSREILDFNPFNSILFDETGQILDCNLSAMRFFNLSGPVEDRTAKFNNMLRVMIPGTQPDGRRSVPFPDRLRTAFSNGLCEFETCFVVAGQQLIFDITMKSVRYKNQAAVVVYMIDLTAQKEIQHSLTYHGALLDALGRVANLLLVIDAKDLESTMQTALELIGRAASVDRAYIWKNHSGKDDRLYTTQLFQWSPGRAAEPESEFLDLSYDEDIPVWKEQLLRGQCINLLRRTARGKERRQFELHGVVSLLIVPIFLQDEFWGFIGFDDCFEERAFLDIEENVLRICGFMAMVICDTIQNEVAVHLVAEREAALISAQIKSNFLANMSHEIRTPMNAIQGMTELIMHENISDTVRGHAGDIHNACRGLLTIINDILDISKIESGKLEIAPQRYHIASLLMDVIAIIRQRLEKKNIAFVVNIDPCIPSELIGDEVRIKQILINLLVNAVKFTQEGQITLRVTCQEEGEGRRLTFAVSDTGIGIRDEDRDKIFFLFQQIDTKKNRNIEGTGLGLSISKQLAEMMDGSIRMESEYGVGSTFTVDILQVVANVRPVASLNNPGRTSVLIYESRPVYQSSLIFALDSLGCHYRLCPSRAELHTLLNEFHYDYIFVSSLSANMVQDLVVQKELSSVIAVLDSDNLPQNRGNMLSLSMPIHCLQIANILNGEYESYSKQAGETQAVSIYAPEAKVLVVDDNTVNLKVAAGLLKTYGIVADTAISGMVAVEMVQRKDYDLVFMDHMMPEMDGIDTTVAIRKLGSRFETLPIVALTANAVSEMKEMFKAEGLNDFLPKPIEMIKLSAILTRWLSEDKLLARPEAPSGAPEIPGLDTEKGLRNAGGTLNDYTKALGLYVTDSESRLQKLNEYHENGDSRAFILCAHALKRASSGIGADALSGLAAQLEAAGKAQDAEYIDAHLADFAEAMGRLLAVIRAQDAGN